MNGRLGRRRGAPLGAVRAVLGVASIVAMLTAGSARVWAQDAGATEGASQSRATAFRAVTGSQAEHVSGGALMVGAYAVVWVLVLLFVVRLAFLQSRTQREVESLESRLGDGGTKPPPE